MIHCTWFLTQRIMIHKVIYVCIHYFLIAADGLIALSPSLSLSLSLPPPQRISFGKLLYNYLQISAFLFFILFMKGNRNVTLNLLISYKFVVYNHNFQRDIAFKADPCLNHSSCSKKYYD